LPKPECAKGRQERFARGLGVAAALCL